MENPKAENQPEKKRPRTAHLAAHDFKPGQTGNPGGRPVGSLSMTTILREILSSKATKKSKKTRAEEVIDAMIAKAKKGNVEAAKEIFNRIDGKVIERVMFERVNPLESLTDEELEAAARGAGGPGLAIEDDAGEEAHPE